MNIFVTGATGYIGSYLTSFALEKGHNVIFASRSKPVNFTSDWVHYDIMTDTPIVLPDGIDVVIHLAASTNHTSYLHEQCELASAKNLINAAKASSAKFIFVSSQTAKSDAPTTYGRTKWAIEQAVLSAGGFVIRPGQVYGGELKGLYGLLVNIVKLVPVLPAFLPSPKIQPIHIEDLSMGLLSIAERDDILPRIYCLADPEPVSFTKFLHEIAQFRLRCWRLFIPVPVIVVNLLAFALSQSLRSKFGIDRLRSLFRLPIMETSSDLECVGLSIRSLDSGLLPPGNCKRKQALREGRAFLTYVSKDAPSLSLLSRYVRAVERLGDGKALGLPGIFIKFPILMSLLDSSTWHYEDEAAEYLWRLDIATTLAEATPIGARRFLGLGQKYNALNCLLSICNALVNEFFWRLLRPLVFSFSRFKIRRQQ